MIIAVLIMTGILAFVLSVGTCMIISTSDGKQLEYNIIKDKGVRLFHWTSETKHCSFCGMLINHRYSCPYSTQKLRQDKRSSLAPSYDSGHCPLGDGFTQQNSLVQSASHPWLFDKVQHKKRKMSLGTVCSMV